MQIPQYGQEAGGQGLQVAEVGVIFLSRLISALGLCRVPACLRAAPSPAQLAAPASAWSLRPPLSALSLLLASAQSQSDCCATVIISEATQGRATCQH